MIRGRPGGRAAYAYGGACRSGVHRVRASALRGHFEVTSQCGADPLRSRAPNNVACRSRLIISGAGGCGGLPGEVILTCCCGRDRFVGTQRFYSSLYKSRTSPRACSSFITGGVRQQEHNRWSGAQRTTGLVGCMR
ncbi:hypothetical protein NDU88_004449 [Pleurodeles waltl]|uniref:Uncharacterized protein n=1 Tax=Pleurodeles waltl TaxID=8319 RepID=A0AAV7SIT5_PLEWA|nr:hypothetical protein NDU88_004449 [Pleurodeles waltl]